ncbi:hypothetical protein GOP47_0003245 [Adiantum capillus-veneris]|uniref:Uncharacterized protein n=1 Tax=Adiantum capillus-veneris TaxID=13818 RepID=A0A9D4VDL4_ADICA|nr:hypothetical protein GOP47_0003245 [Adiantum capillus-veneris]
MMEVDNIVIAVVISTGQNIPKDSPPVVFAEPAEVKDGQALLQFLQLHVSQTTIMIYIGVVKDEYFGWRQFSESLQSIPRAGTQIVIFCKVLPPQSIPSGGDAVWTDEAILWALKEDYMDTLILSRRTYTNSKRQEMTPLPLSPTGSLDMDIGQYFKLVGRDETYSVLLHGFLRLYKNYFTKSGSPTAFSRQPAFFSMVSFSGAGKSTFGLDFGNFWMEKWTQIPQDMLEQVLKCHLQDTERKEYLEMIEQFHIYNMCCYHSLEVTSTGRWLPQEDGLYAPEILALRCLYAAVCRPGTCDYNSILSDWLAKRHDLLTHIRLKHVIKFIRSSLGIDPKKKFLICWFIDEVNAAQGSFPQDVGDDEDKPTWLQSVLSEYVENLHRLHKEENTTFPILIVGTTHFSTRSVNFTKTRKANAILVPLRPLKLKEMEDVILGLMDRLALTLQQPPGLIVPEWLKLVLRFCGGMPRVFALVFKSLSKEKFSSQSDYFSSYLRDANKVAVVLRALAVYVLGNVVTRRSKVMEGSHSIFNDSWGDLEAEGLVALMLHDPTEWLKSKENIEMGQLVTSVDPGNVEAKLRTQDAFLLHARKNADSYAFLGPSSFGADSWFCAFEIKERRKVFFLLQLRSPLFDHSYLSCEKILDSFLDDCEKWFCVPKLSRTQLQRRERVLSSTCEEVLEMATTRRYDLRPSHKADFGPRLIEDIDSESQDVEMEMEEEKKIRDYVIYIYCTDEVSRKTRSQLKDLALCGDPWVEKIILWHSQKDPLSTDPMALLSLLQYLNIEE